MPVIHYIEGLWASQRFLENSVAFLDYACLIDLVAAIIVLGASKIKHDRKKAEKIGRIGNWIALFAAIGWTADIRFSHRLSVIQQRTSTATFSKQSDRLVSAEDRLKEMSNNFVITRTAASNAIAASVTASSVVSNANVVVAEHLGRHLTEQQKNELMVVGQFAAWEIIADFLRQLFPNNLEL